MRIRAITLAVLASGFTVMQAAPALAHEERDVGRYTFAVGFGSEPAYAGVLNSIQLLLSDAHGKPVTSLRPGVTVSVGFGSQTQRLSIEPNSEIGEFGTPGDYRAWFIPTRPGSYRFHFSGRVNGQPVDETFTSGPKTFDDVQDPTEAEFPVKDPTIGQLSERVTREVPRLEAGIAGARTQASEVADEAGTATTLSVVAIVVGLLALAVGIASMWRGGRPRG
jgi:hypothetical protein